MGDMGDMRDLVKKKFEPKEELSEKKRKKQNNTYLRLKQHVLTCSFGT